MPFDYDSIRSIIEGSETAEQPAEEQPKPKIEQPVKTAPPAAPTSTTAGTPSPAPQTAPTQGIKPSETPGKQPADKPRVRAEPYQQSFVFTPDERIPKKLRDLMIENTVTEDEIRQVCEARGYVPLETPLWEYDKVNPGIIDGLLVASWPQVYTAVKSAREKMEIPFDV